MVETGKIKRWFRKQGYGFIVNPNAGEEDIYFRIDNSQRLRGREDTLGQGEVVQFRTRPSKKKPGRLEAYDVRLQLQEDPGHEHEFHNPYTFIPTPPRGHIDPGTFPGDYDPLESNHSRPALHHAKLAPNLWTGHIPIKLTTVTPLLLLDADSKSGGARHQTYDVLDYLPESSLRGVLRSAYEIVTNSRYGAFSNPDRLWYRTAARRELYEASPEELLDASLRPAASRSKLSPADRLFGWAPRTPGGNEGYRGRIRVVCEDGARTGIVHRFQNGELPLAILGQPKPSQGRFYVAEDLVGSPQAAGIGKRGAGYACGKSLRGRKLYWHHRGLEAGLAKDYWKPTVEDRTQSKVNDRYQEYRRPDRHHGPQRDSQNRSVKGWIKPDTVFRASLHLKNAECEEVGALLWLLSLPEGRYFRVGHGKPLGFGSVRIEVDRDRCAHRCVPLGSGTHWVEYYMDFDAPPPACLDDAQERKCVDVFKETMNRSYADSSVKGSAFDNLPFISGFLRVLGGPDNSRPVHYPRLCPKPNAKGENYRWFVSNERGAKLPLPSVGSADGLPYHPSR